MYYIFASCCSSDFSIHTSWAIGNVLCEALMSDAPYDVLNTLDGDVFDVDGARPILDCLLSIGKDNIDWDMVEGDWYGIE